jgi:hypothetical protein
MFGALPTGGPLSLIMKNLCAPSAPVREMKSFVCERLCGLSERSERAAKKRFPLCLRVFVATAAGKCT